MPDPSPRNLLKTNAYASADSLAGCSERRQAFDLTLAAARLRRLERAARMEFAVRQTVDLVLAAEVEVRMPADRRSASGSCIP